MREALSSQDVLELFRLAPEAGRARSLRKGLELQLCSSYASLLATVEAGLSLEPGCLTVLGPTSSDEYPFASRAYASHWQVGLAIRSNIPSLIEPALRELSKGWHDTSEFRVATHQSDLIDHAAESYLSGREGQRIRRRMRTNAGGDPSDLRGISSKQLSELRPVVYEALETISDLDRGMADEVREYVREVRLVDSDAIGGMSSLRFFGTIFLRRPHHAIGIDSNRVHLFGGLVHETSHLHLHALMVQDPLVLNREERFDSPLRRDKRPMLGIYHATFVLARLSRLFGRWNQAEPGCTAVIDELHDAQTRLGRGVATIRAHAHLTERGSALLEHMAHVERVAR